MKERDLKLIIFRIKPEPQAILFSSGLTLEELEKLRDKIALIISEKKGLRQKGEAVSHT